MIGPEYAAHIEDDGEHWHVELMAAPMRYYMRCDSEPDALRALSNMALAARKTESPL